MEDDDVEKALKILEDSEEFASLTPENQLVARMQVKEKVAKRLRAQKEALIGNLSLVSST